MITRRLAVVLALIAFVAPCGCRHGPPVRPPSERDSGNKPEQVVPGVPARPAAGEDSLVLLRSRASGRKLEQVVIRPTGETVKVAEVPLPPGFHLGLALMSRGTCFVVNWGDVGKKSTAYKWAIGSKKVVPVGRLPASNQTLFLDSYSRMSDRAIAYEYVGEGYSYPLLWQKRSDSWEEIPDVYPDLRKHLLPSPGVTICSASFSPDGSLLAVGVPRTDTTNILLYHLATRQVRVLKTGRTQYIWVVGVSADNQEVAWLESVGGSEGEEEAEKTVDPYAASGFGIISVKTGRKEYWPLEKVAGLPPKQPYEHPFPMQGQARVAFSADNQRIFFPMSVGLVRFDRKTQRARVVEKESDSFVVLPPAHRAGR